MFGVKIEFFDGASVYIDPIEDEPTEKDGIISLHNSLYKYEYEKNKIKNISKYDLCNVCLFDIDHFDCHDKCNKY